MISEPTTAVFDTALSMLRRGQCSTRLIADYMTLALTKPGPVSR